MYFAAVVLHLVLLSCFTSVANTTKKSKVCGIKNWPKCALEQTTIETSNFDVLPTRLPMAENDDHISISLKVYRNECPSLETEGVQWYRLEAFAAGTNRSLGQFIEPVQSRRLETYACRNNTVLVFQTCEPHPLDLPRQYNWSISKGKISQAEVCFRLTVLDTDEQCKYTESCIALAQNASSSSGSGESKQSNSSSDDSEESTNASGENESENWTRETMNLTLEQRCHARRNCSNAKMRLFCGSDGNTYTSRCHIRLEECLTQTNIDISYAGPCVSEIDPVCHNIRETLKKLIEELGYPLWLPTCDCDGLVKPIQCDEDSLNSGQLECWCSYSNSISEVTGTRRKIVDHCTDPATFEFNCSSTW